jgi:hypothetical protein
LGPVTVGGGGGGTSQMVMSSKYITESKFRPSNLPTVIVMWPSTSAVVSSS